MNAPHPLEKFCETLSTRMGKAFPGERAVFRGHNLHSDLQNMSWFELYMFGISGKKLSKSEIHLLDANWACTCYPDARLWNNRVVALAGSARSTSALALAAGGAITEAQIYGLQAMHLCADFLVRAQKKLDEGMQLEVIIEEEIRLHKYIKGFGRPIAAQEVDERMPTLFRVMQEEGMQQGKYVQLVFQIEKCLIQMGKDMHANYAAIVAAVPLDFGLTVRETLCYLYNIVHGGMPPVYLEALERPAGATFPLKCEQIKYQGPPDRVWE